MIASLFNILGIKMIGQIKTLLASSSTKENKNGTTACKVSIQSILDEGCDLSLVKKIAKSQGMKLIKNDTALSFDSTNMEKTVQTFLEKLNQAA